MLQLKNVSIDLDNRHIINDVSLKLNEGEILSMIGESGVGKTTLLRAIAGLVDVRGEIIFDSDKVIGPSERLMPGVEGVSTVFQDYKLMHNRSVYENIAYPLRSYVEDEQMRITEELIEILQLDSHRDHYPQELSGGQKQRVAIARSLASYPKLLLMDEPFSNIDVALKEIVKERVFDYLKEEGVTVILATHDPKDALAISDRIAVLQQGKFAQVGSAEKIYDAPSSPYVMSCFGHCDFWTKEAYELDFGVVSDADLVGIRVENINVSDDAKEPISIVVAQCIYQGHHHLIRGQSISDNEVYFYHASPIPVGEKVKLHVDKGQVCFFK